MRIGIDIGTHTARAAYLDADGRPQLIRMPDGSDWMPALARQTMHGLEVGAPVARSLVGNIETTVCGCTRLMGRAGTLPRQLLERLPFTVREVGGEAQCDLLYAEVPASAIYGCILRALVEAAEHDTGAQVDSIVLTVPASAEDRFRVQARAAAEAQGITVSRLINQPVAALLAIGILPQAGRVAIINCGGGSTEISLAERRSNGTHILATACDSLLGGDDLAWAVAEGLNQRFCQSAHIDVFAVGDSRVAAQGLRDGAEEIMRQVAFAPDAHLVLDHGGGFGRDLATHVRRSDLDAWLAPLLDRIGLLGIHALEQARLTPQQIDAVMLIGDWAFLPALQETIAGIFGRPAAQIHTSNAEVLAVYGAAIAGAANAPTHWDVTPYPLGINCYYGDIELFSPIVQANLPIPTPPIGSPGACIEEYQTRYPDQTTVRLDILQYRGSRNADPAGQGRVQPSECEVLGNWEFSGLQPRKGQHAAFTVTFAVDADGILQLYARETATGHSLAARITRGIG